MNTESVTNTTAVTMIWVTAVVFVTLSVFMETRTDPQFGLIVIGLAMAVVLGAAVGAMNCFLFEAFTWWQQLWGILMRPLFLMSCLFFIFDDIPQPYRDWLWWNPLVHVVGQMRRAFYPSYVGDYVSYTYVFGLGLGLFAIGLALLIRYHRDLQNS
ncbi:ABC transporter permease, partial [Paracoccus sp. (in: a-proteobacteria)]|uniref:ABC transporter permease n=1 Tax=Paracoccus sp. TaxID=267 RepID=UPI00396CC3C7